MGSATTALQQGTSANATVNITRTNNFAGTVNLTVTGLPTGVTGTFTPAAATGNTSTLDADGNGTATVGQATVTVRGNSGTLAEQTATFTLNVTQATGGSGNTVFEFCAAGNTPLWFAVQDGATGTWTRVTPSGTNNTRFQFNITQARAGIAYVIGTTSGFVGSAARGSLAAPYLGRHGTRASPAESSVAHESVRRAIGCGWFRAVGHLRNAGGAERNRRRAVSAWYGQDGEWHAWPTWVRRRVQASRSGRPPRARPVRTPSFVLEDVPDGALDLVAGRTTTTISGTSFSIALDKLIIRRGVNAANNSTLPVLDFGARGGVRPGAGEHHVRQHRNGCWLRAHELLHVRRVERDRCNAGRLLAPGLRDRSSTTAFRRTGKSPATCTWPSGSRSRA